MGNKFKVLVYEPGKDPYLKYIYRTGRELSNIIEGPIEGSTPFTSEDMKDIVLFTHMEGKFIGLDVNFYLNNDFIVGSCIFMTENEEGVPIDLSYPQLKSIQDFILNDPRNKNRESLKDIEYSL